MKESAIATKQLAALLSVLGHPMRIRIVLELRGGERDVGSLRDVLGLSHPGVSQHLALLRSHRLVVERREGRRVIYRLPDPSLGDWLLTGLRYLESAESRLEDMRSAVREVAAAWGSETGGNQLARMAAATGNDESTDLDTRSSLAAD